MSASRPWSLAFGDDAEAYEAARPSYPQELIDDLVADGPQRVLDVGCGTGIAGRLFAARGCSVAGIEPDPRMAQLAARIGIDVVISSFEDWQPHEAFDLLIAAQSWHCVDRVAGPAKAAVALRPGGRFAAFWNSYEHPARLRDTFVRTYAELAPELLEFSISLGRVQADDPYGDDRHRQDLERSGEFVNIERRSYWASRTYSASAWTRELGTHSDHHALDQQRQAEVFDAVAAIIEREGGEFTVALRAGLITATRR